VEITSKRTSGNAKKLTLGGKSSRTARGAQGLKRVSQRESKTQGGEEP